MNGGDYINHDFPRTLRKLRDRRGISRAVLSQLVGLSKNMIALYESGEREPTASVIVRLAELFEVPTDYLLGLKEKNLDSSHYSGNTTEKL